jgi:nicotinamidase-related amidase
MEMQTFYARTISDRKEMSWTVVREKAALLVVDMQNDFVKQGAICEVPGIRIQIPLIKRLVETCRELGVPVIYTQQVFPRDSGVKPLVLEMFPLLESEGLRDGTVGAEICSQLAPRPGEVVIKKMGFNAFHNTPLESILRNIRGRRKVDTIIICGTATNICCESTARGAVERDYKVVFGSDITSAWTDEFQSVTLKNIRYAFGRVMRCDEIINALRYGERDGR